MKRAAEGCWAAIVTVATLAVLGRWMTGSDGVAGPMAVSLVGCLAVVSTLAPLVGLTVLALLVPLSSAIATLIGGGLLGFPLVIVGSCAVVFGWAVNQLASTRRGQSRWPTVGWALAGWMVALAVAAVWNANGAGLATLTVAVSGAGDSPWTGLLAAASGPAVALAIVTTCRRGQAVDRVAWVLALSLGAAAVLNVTRVAEIALRSDAPMRRAVEVVAAYRFNTHFGDLNAAGAMFAMGAVLASGLAAASLHRVLMGAASLASLLGVLLSGSRSASAALIAAVAVAVVGGSTRSRRLAAVVLLVITVGVAAAVHVRREAAQEDIATAMTFRVGMLRTGWDMLVAHPLFGVGPNQFHAMSERFMPAQLAREFFPRENAHNNFVQIAAETGMVGFVAFVIVLTTVWRAFASRQAPRWRTLALTVLAFLVTCLTGHSLLVPPVSLAFWMVIGLTGCAEQVSD